MLAKDIMTKNVVNVRPEESVEVAARALRHYNIGALPVCDAQGKVCGMVTDRDLVIRCVAANRSVADTTVRQVMTKQLVTVEPGTDISAISARNYVNGVIDMEQAERLAEQKKAEEKRRLDEAKAKFYYYFALAGGKKNEN